MFQCIQHPYKVCSFFDTHSQSLQCAQCVLPPDLQELNEGLIDIDRITFIANRLLEQQPLNQVQFDSDGYWLTIERVLNISLENAQSYLQHAYTELKQQVQHQFQSLKKQYDSSRLETQRHIKTRSDIKNLLNAINKQSPLAQYTQQIRELSDAIDGFQNYDLKGLSQRLNDSQLRFNSQLDQQLLIFNDDINKVCLQGQVKIDCEEIPKNQEIDKTLRSQAISRSMTQTSFAKKMKKEAMKQVVKKELRCSLATDQQLTSVICCITLVIAGTHDGQLLVYDNESWEEVQRFQSHDDQIKVLCKQQGEQIYLASGSLDKSIKVYKREFNDGLAQFFLSEYKHLIGHHGAILDLLMIDNIKHKQFNLINLLVSSSADNTVRVWNYITGDALMNYSGHRMDVHALAFSPQLNVICSGSNDKTIRVWDAVNFELCRPIQNMKAHTDSVLGLSILEEKQSVLASCGSDKTIKLWDLKKGILIKSFNVGVFMARIVQYQIGLMAIIGLDQNIDIWDYNITTRVHQLKGASKIQSICVDDEHVYSVENKNINQYY